MLAKCRGDGLGMCSGKGERLGITGPAASWANN